MKNLEAVKKILFENPGITYREIMKKTGIKSTNTVNYYIKKICGKRKTYNQLYNENKKIISIIKKLPLWHNIIIGYLTLEEFRYINIIINEDSET